MVEVRTGLAHRGRKLHGELDAVSGGPLQGLLSSVVESVVAHAAVVGAAPRFVEAEGSMWIADPSDMRMPARKWAMHRRAARCVWPVCRMRALRGKEELGKSGMRH